MRYLRHIIRTKGLIHAIERALQVAWRYSFGERKFSEMMSGIENIFLSRGVRVTFCVTASLLDNHSALLKKYNTRGHEFAAHGFHHTDLKKKTSTSSPGY